VQESALGKHLAMMMRSIQETELQVLEGCVKLPTKNLHKNKIKYFIVNRIILMF